MLITWDEPKRLSNLDKHGLDFADLTEDFFNDAVASASSGNRIKFVGTMHKNRIVVVIAALLGQEAIAVISLRRADRRERRSLDG